MVILNFKFASDGSFTIWQFFGVGASGTVAP
jgi:hypothetical protein